MYLSHITKNRYTILFPVLWCGVRGQVGRSCHQTSQLISARHKQPVEWRVSCADTLQQDISPARLLPSCDHSVTVLQQNDKTSVILRLLLTCCHHNTQLCQWWVESQSWSPSSMSDPERGTTMTTHSSVSISVISCWTHRQLSISCIRWNIVLV